MASHVLSVVYATDQEVFVSDVNFKEATNCLSSNITLNQNSRSAKGATSPSRAKAQMDRSERTDGGPEGSRTPPTKAAASTSGPHASLGGVDHRQEPDGVQWSSVSGGTPCVSPKTSGN